MRQEGPKSEGQGLVAYLSMEVAVADAVPTYSGGLGVLAGDHLRAAADAGVPMVGVTLLYHQGYFSQALDEAGGQQERPVAWDPAEHLERVGFEVSVPLAGRYVRVGAWRFVISGARGVVPVYFLDTRVPGNLPEDQELTDVLYGGDQRYRLRQELVLGLGGLALLRALGAPVRTVHLNEGHAAFALLGLLAEADGNWEAVRERCVFTTHTPVAAGHDRFPEAMVRAEAGEVLAAALAKKGLLAPGGELNMTELAIAGSRWVNAVSQRHAQVTASMFPGIQVAAVTNGVHAPTWVAPPVGAVLDRWVPGWRQDNGRLRAAEDALPLPELATAHRVAKEALASLVAERGGPRLDPTVLTLGVARRATAYKRTTLVLADPEGLRRVVAEVGPLQLVFAGKAHPRDEPGKALIRDVLAARDALAGTVTIAFVPDYDLAVARTLVAGVDVWCNTPVRPYEASGTSGMKAAVNGVPSLSVLDGWWVEGHEEGVTGWAIGGSPERVGDPTGRPGVDPTYEEDARSFVEVLATAVAPLYYRDPEGFLAVGRGALARNGSWFTTQRMVEEYAVRAYGLPSVAQPAGSS